MAVHEFKNRYIGTIAGFLWSVVNPLIMMFIYWFVFSVGFRSQPVSDVPYIVYFLSGYLPWSFFFETLTNSTNMLKKNAHLIKKVVFPTEFLVFVTMITSLLSHLIMLSIFIIIMYANHLTLSPFSILFIFPLFLVAIFSIGAGWIVSSFSLFLKDVEQIVNIILNIWFWFTPIIWGIDLVPPNYKYLIKYNPMYYLIEGYRSAFIYKDKFNNNEIICFSIISVFLFVCGGLIFRKLKPEFAEVI